MDSYYEKHGYGHVILSRDPDSLKDIVSIKGFVLTINYVNHRFNPSLLEEISTYHHIRVVVIKNFGSDRSFGCRNFLSKCFGVFRSFKNLDSIVINTSDFSINEMIALGELALAP